MILESTCPGGGGGGGLLVNLHLVNRLLSVTKYLMLFRNSDWQNEMWRKRFVSEKKSILRNTT